MNDFTFTTSNPLTTNTDTMDVFLSDYFFTFFDNYAILIKSDGSYAEVLDGNTCKWALHASGDGDFTHHRIRFEEL